MAGGQGGAKKRISKRKAPVVLASDQKAAAKPTAKRSKQAAAEPSASDPSVELKLAGIVADDNDYSDDEAKPAARTMTVDKKTHAQITKQTGKLQRKGMPAPPGVDAGVVYMGHIPHGFYEEEMRGFFSQFGELTRLRLARNPKTGKSKHFAFIEFAHKEVAQIVAKSMNGYLMYSKLLVCQLLAPEKIHPATFKHCDKPFKLVDWVGKERKRHNKERTKPELASQQKKRRASDSRKRRKLEGLGIDYELPTVAPSRNTHARALAKPKADAEEPKADAKKPKAADKKVAAPAASAKSLAAPPSAAPAAAAGKAKAPAAKAAAKAPAVKAAAKAPAAKAAAKAPVVKADAPAPKAGVKRKKGSA